MYLVRLDERFLFWRSAGVHSEEYVPGLHEEGGGGTYYHNECYHVTL